MFLLAQFLSSSESLVEFHPSPAWAAAQPMQSKFGCSVDQHFLKIYRHLYYLPFPEAAYWDPHLQGPFAPPGDSPNGTILPGLAHDTQSQLDSSKGP